MPYHLACSEEKLNFISDNQYISIIASSKIVGRLEEIKELDRSYHSDEAEFVIVYGRRRVGKTFLVREFFHDTFDFQLTGIYDKPKELQLTNFSIALQEHSNQMQPTPAFICILLHYTNQNNTYSLAVSGGADMI